jgi:MEMO1 family protein
MPKVRRVLAACLLLVAFAPGCTCRSSGETSSRAALPESSNRSIPIPMASARNPFGPTVAGSFYPASPATLDKMVHTFLEDGQAASKSIPADRRVVAIVTPHAGYVYSGPVAGWAFNALDRASINTAIVMGPNHRAHADGACTVDADAYRTPLGDVPIATDLVQQLIRDSAGSLTARAKVFETEHSVDVQIPFVKVALPNARVVPIVVPYMPRQQFRALADMLFKLVASDPSVVLIASSDLSHFFEYNEASKLDDQIMREVEGSDIESLLSHHDMRSGPCGVAAIAVALETMNHFKGGKVVRLRYQNSGDTAGDHGRVVGYGAMALTVPREN